MPFTHPLHVGPWRVRRTEGPSGAFHHRAFEADDLEPVSGTFLPTIWLHQPTVPALVLGSTQSEAVIDSDRARSDGWEICRRRSGGGLVVVRPDASVWIDVFIPPHHSRWSDDVGQAFDFVGQWWVDALRSLTPTQLSVHRGPLLNPDVGRLLCFGGLGPGEVSVASHKVVGLSQRRSRLGARFQGLALLEADNSAVDRYGSAELKTALELAPRHGWPADVERPTADAVAHSFLNAAS